MSKIIITIMHFKFIHLLLNDINKSPKIKMDLTKIPSFLNTEGKWNECVRSIDSIDNFEEIFYNSPEDDDMYTVDILRIMKK